MSENFTPTVSKTGFKFRLPDSGSDEISNDHDRRVERLVKSRNEAPGVEQRERRDKYAEWRKENLSSARSSVEPKEEGNPDPDEDVEKLIDGLDGVPDDAKDVLKMLAATGTQIHGIK